MTSRVQERVLRAAKEEFLDAWQFGRRCWRCG